MTEKQWNAICSLRDEYKKMVALWLEEIGEELIPLQIEAARLDGTPEYPVETPVVYNETLDEITQNDDIKLIVIGDNPGKNEQLAINRRYLVGQAGKLADGFFKRNPIFGVDFRKNVIIFNKTPIHSAKTKELSYILKNASPAIHRIYEESQIWCAEHIAQLHNDLDCALWLVGYGELGTKGLFKVYKETLSSQYQKLPSGNPAKNSLLIFQHFSMNRFSIDLRDFMSKNPSLSITEAVQELGLKHRQEILGF